MPTAVSAPGKVLLAGGYLVLDPKYTGLVFGLSARIHVVVRTDQEAASDIIEVQSPQFRDAIWRYQYQPAGNTSSEGDTEKNPGVQISQVQGDTPTSPNKFVETALLYALTYISTYSIPIKPTTITILADNDYYSNTSPNTLSSFPNFTDFAVRLQDAHKTGLGSSAALVTAFTGAVLSHYLPSTLFSLTTEAGRTKLHNLAQISHCAAQGKVGSGFDVAAAVHGTCIYRRFSPAILSSLGEPGSSPDFAARVRALVDDTPQTWDTSISKEGVTIPPGTALVMCDVDCGSETVGMVKQVQAWRKSDPAGAEALWDELQAANEQLAEKLRSGQVDQLESAFAAIRSKIRDMGTKSGVPIEPVEQTELLDAATREVEGVFGGVVPGAGGYDAIVLLIKDDDSTKEKLNRFLEEWSLKKGSKVKLLKAKGELQGARLEGAEVYGMNA